MQFLLYKIFFCTTIFLVNQQQQTEAKPQARIANGWKFPRYKFRSNVKIELHSWFTYIVCSGVLLDELTVLTSANCLNHDYNYVGVYIGLSTSWWGKSYQYYRKMKRNLRHMDFKYVDGRRVNDIAMILLNEPVTEMDYVYFADYKKEELIKPGDTIFIVGWGWPTGNQASASIQTVLDKSKCHSTFGGNDFFENKQFCSLAKGSEGSTVCGGDFGGPAYFIDKYGNDMLVGITSNIRNEGLCGKVGSPTVLMSVSHYYDWIEYARKKIK